jgi:hypothetical protein
MSAQTQLALVLVAFVTFVTVRACGAAAQGPARMSPELALARLCVSEAGWTCWETGDGLGIHEVMLRGSARTGLRYETYARSYARRLFGARPHDLPRLRWVGQMEPSGAEPSAWPRSMTRRVRGSVRVEPHAPWSAYRARWLAVLARAREVMSELTLDDVDEWGVCDRPVHDWGGWMDRARAERIGLVPVDCGLSGGSTRNDFYCRPSVDPTCVEVDRE